MDGTASYDDDILAWAEQQAGFLRALRDRASDLPAGLDLDHLAEEIEDVGKSELHRAESFLRLLLVHLLKIASAPHARPADHWRREARLFQFELTDSLTRSIRRKMDLDHRWRQAIELADGDLVLETERVLPGLPETCPLRWSDLLGEVGDADTLAERIRMSAARG